MRDKLKNPYLAFLVFTSFTLIMSIILKIKLNFNYNPSDSKEILEIINMSVALVLFVIVNLFIVFISAFGTYFLLNLISTTRKHKSLKNSNIKTNIYLSYLIIHTAINLLLSVYIVIFEKAVDQTLLAIISLVFYSILSILLYYITKHMLAKKELLVSIILIFFLNGIMPILQIFNNIELN